MTLARDEEQIFERFLADLDVATVSESDAIPFWRDVCQAIRADAGAKSKAEFLRWPSLTNFSVPETWTPEICYSSLRASADWSSRWLRLTRESPIGSPKEFSRDSGASPILVQHAYHLFRYEALTGKSLIDCDAIFEIGGGYGSFCRLLKNAGFKGVHIIYDLPHVAAIQRLYLLLSGFVETPRSEIFDQTAHAFCLISGDSLNEAFDALKASNLRVGFVATWSLSEFPLAARALVLPRFLDICECVLIAYQPEFMGLDNMGYFEDVVRQRPERPWRFEGVMPSYYMFA
jgi:hypothetical protein